MTSSAIDCPDYEMTELTESMTDSGAPSASEHEQLKSVVLKPGDVRFAAMNLLARREHLRAELQRKLIKRFKEEPLAEASIDLDSVLNQLQDDGLLSDQRFVESYIRLRGGNGYGPDRIRHELRQKGAAGELVKTSMETCEIDWFSRAVEVRKKKFGDAVVDDLKEKSRQLRFLNYRGFGGEMAAFALEKG